jgi:hypothetical protein
VEVALTSGLMSTSSSASTVKLSACVLGTLGSVKETGSGMGSRQGRRSAGGRRMRDALHSSSVHLRDGASVAGRGEREWRSGSVAAHCAKVLPNTHERQSEINRKPMKAHTRSNFRAIGGEVGERARHTSKLVFSIRCDSSVNESAHLLGVT